MIIVQMRHDNCAPLGGSLFSCDWCEKAAEKGDGMEFGGRYLLTASRPEVWAALNDAEMLKAAIPGCRRINWTASDALEVEIRVNLGVAHPVFTGDLVLSDVLPATRYRLTGKGRGGLLGRAHGAADISLADRPGGTELRFLAEGGASGQLMRLGQALVGTTAQHVIDGFFQRFAAAMGTAITSLDPSL
jgi:hypothetical protein